MVFLIGVCYVTSLFSSDFIAACMTTGCCVIMIFLIHVSLISKFLETLIDAKQFENFL